MNGAYSLIQQIVALAVCLVYSVISSWSHTSEDHAQCLLTLDLMICTCSQEHNDGAEWFEEPYIGPCPPTSCKNPRSQKTREIATDRRGISESARADWWRWSWRRSVRGGSVGGWSIGGRATLSASNRVVASDIRHWSRWWSDPEVSRPMQLPWLVPRRSTGQVCCSIGRV